MTRPGEQDRAQRRAQERELVAAAVTALRSSEGWRAWLSARAHFHHYSLHNQLLIALQHPTATRVAGFRAWLALGYCVRRDERAIRIWAPRPPSRRRTERWQASGCDPATRPRLTFRLTAVFAQDQVQPLPPPATPMAIEAPIAAIGGDSHAHLLPCLAALADRVGYTVRRAPLRAAEGTCDPRSQTITIDAGLSANGAVAALIHELAHALVRVDHRDGDPHLDYAQEELVVESVALSACSVAGLDTRANSIPYLAAWSQDSDIAVLEHAAALVNRLANRIEDAIGAASITAAA